ncbi:MAG: M23 family metallopeptidase [Burkholderiaceae bacterium]
MEFYRTTRKGLVLKASRPRHGQLFKTIRSLHPARTLTAAVLAMGAAVTAFGVSSPADLNTSNVQRVIDQLVVPASEGTSMRRFRSSMPVSKGDTLDWLLREHGARDAQLRQFVRSDATAAPLRNLRAGSVVHVDIDSIGRVHELRYSLGFDEQSQRSGKVQQLIITRNPYGLKAQVQQQDLVRTTQMAHTTITNTLFQATNAADIPVSVASQIADVFGNEIRFDRDIHRGDQIKVIYELLHEPDSFEAPEPGRLIAAELLNRGKRYTAVYVPEVGGTGGYYDFEGNSAASSFLRYPIEFSRISSGFSRARLHPVLGKRRAHRGTDFAAPAGTKIRATASGIIRSIGNQRGYGRTIVIQHEKRISTLYAHMRGYRKGLRAGSKVRQGDVIGYVGSSGWATGPHLHYEIHRKGRPVNPLRVKLPAAAPLTDEMLVQHTERVEELKSQFALLEQVQLASNFQ